MIAFGVLLAAAGVILLLCTAVIALQNRSYAACSSDVTAAITYKRHIAAKNGHRYEFVTTYSIDGTEYKKTVLGTLSEYDSLQIGDSIQLKYKPDNPKRAIRADRLAKNGLRPLFIISAGLIAAGAILFAAGRM